MHTFNEFEAAKKQALSSYRNYCNKLEEFTYDDSRKMNRRLELSKIYNKAVADSLAFRQLLSEMNIKSFTD